MSFITQPIKAFTSWLSQPYRKRVYLFSEGSSKDTPLLSLKGANLCEMSKNRSLHVPPGCVISTAAAMEFYRSGELSEELVGEYTAAVYEVERAAGQVFGSVSSTVPPLLLCVRGGALVPLPRTHPFYLQAYTEASESQFLPGLHKTLVVGMNEEVVNQLTCWTSRRLALRLYCQFLLSFGSCVYDIVSGYFFTLCDLIQIMIL